MVSHFAERRGEIESCCKERELAEESQGEEHSQIRWYYRILSGTRGGDMTVLSILIVSCRHALVLNCSYSVDHTMRIPLA